MDKFLKSIFFFLGGLVLITFIGILLPTPRMVRESFLFSKIDKDSLMRNVPPPRLILIGGSNTSFSINSQMLKDSLNLNPVNTGISGALGIFYMLDNSLAHIKPGDVVVVCPEYSQFYGDAAYGEDYLIRVIMDISPTELFHLRGKHLSTQLSFLPRYAFTKFKFTQYFENEQDPIKREVYQRVAFNEYGDVFRHWTMDKVEVLPYLKLTHGFNERVVDRLVEYKNELDKKGARLFITFPAFQNESFQNQLEEIKLIERSLKAKGFNLLGSPERYRMPDELIFDTPYHLVKDGVKIRTQLLIDDLRKVNVYKKPLKSIDLVILE